jgi:hypothetical protein
VAHEDVEKIVSALGIHPDLDDKSDDIDVRGLQIASGELRV